MRPSLLLPFLFPTLLFAQEEFPALWESKFSIDASYKGCSDDLAYLVGGDLTQLEMLDGATGKSLWVYNFKAKHNVKKCERWAMHDETGTMRFTIDKGKNGGEEVLDLDYRTGAVVASTQLGTRVKEKKAPRKRDRSKRMTGTSAYDAITNTTIDLDYDEKNVMGVKNGTDLLLTVEASGGKTWSTSFTGRVVSRLTKMYLPADAGDVMLDVTIGHGKVFIIYEGITCMDLATGKILWNTTFDNVEVSSGLKIKQEIGRSALPLIAADGVYICDFSKGERTIKKLDLATGAVLWQADKLKKDDIVSDLVLDGGNLIARFGGVIRVEQYIPAMGSGTVDTYKVDYVFEGSTSLRAYNAATGVPVWHTADMDLADNFKKGECNILSNDGKVFACGEKNIYLFDATTGKLLKQGEYNTKAIGKARTLVAHEGAFIIEGEKGIARLSAEFVPVYATNTDKCLLTEMRGDAFIVWTGKELDDRKEFIRFDPLTGKIMGKMEDCYHPHFDPTGDRFVRFDGQKAMLYRTN